MKQRFTIDDVLLIAFLSLTIWHSAHILAAFEIIGELAWLLAFGVDVGIARAAWVSSNRNLSSGARWIAAGWLSFLLASSYGLNVAYYAERHANFWAWALASLFPVSIAAAGAVKSFLANKQAETVAPAPVPDTSTEETDRLRKLLSDKEQELNAATVRYTHELTGMQNQLATRNPDLSVYRERLIEIGKARLNKSQLEDAIDGLLAEVN